MDRERPSGLVVPSLALPGDPEFATWRRAHPRIAGGAGITIDASTPAPKEAGATIVNVTSMATNSFTPPDNSLLVVCWANENSVSNSLVTSMSGSGLTYTHLVGMQQPGRAAADVWVADVGVSPGSMSVTINFPSMDQRAVEATVLVLTGAAPAATQVASAHTQTAGATLTWTTGVTLVAAAVDSWVFAVAADWDTAVTPTFPAGQTFTLNVAQNLSLAAIGDSFWVQGNNAPGNSNLTMNTSTPTGASTTSAMVAFEILAAGIPDAGQPFAREFPPTHFGPF